MKLKKTLSMLIGGICLVAATTVALARPVVQCPMCNGTASASYSYYTKGASHRYWSGSGYKTCRYMVRYKREKVRCSDCGYTLYYTDTQVGESGHTCGLLY